MNAQAKKPKSANESSGPTSLRRRRNQRRDAGASRNCMTAEIERFGRRGEPQNPSRFTHGLGTATSADQASRHAPELIAKCCRERVRWGLRLPDGSSAPTAGPLPVGLEIDAGDDGFAEQEGQAVIAEFALLGRRVDLDPVAEIEQALGAACAPRRWDRTARGAPGPRSRRGTLASRVEIDRPVPALDGDGQQVACLHQFRDARLRVRRVRGGNNRAGSARWRCRAPGWTARSKSRCASSSRRCRRVQDAAGRTRSGRS